MICTDIGEDLVALALGQLPADAAARVEAHLAACAPCLAEMTATRSLVGLARAVPMAAPSAGAEERLLAAVRADRHHDVAHDVPPPVAKPRRVSRALSMFLPLAAAASVLVAMVLTARERPVQVIDGEGFLYSCGDEALPGRALGRSLAEFRFRDGDEIASGSAALCVRLTLAAGTATSSATEPAAGSVELTLAPGARVVRRAPYDVELVAGSIDVAAGPLATPFVVHAPPGYAAVRGTRFSATTSEQRLVVSVREGSVEIGVKGAANTVLSAGQEGLVDADRLLTRPRDGRRAGQGFLTPIARLRPIPAPNASGQERLRASLDVGEGGPVSILPFDDSEPRFLLRLKGDDGREREVKLQRAMLVAAPPVSGGRTWRLTQDHGYELVIEPGALGVVPGRYEARLRYMSYRARSDGAEWLGVAESDPVSIEVPAK